MNIKQLNIAATEYMELEAEEINCNTLAVLVDGVKVIYDLNSNAQQLNDIVEKMEMNIEHFDDEEFESFWHCSAWMYGKEPKFMTGDHVKRNEATIKCIASVLNID